MMYKSSYSKFDLGERFDSHNGVMGSMGGLGAIMGRSCSRHREGLDSDRILFRGIGNAAHFLTCIPRGKAGRDRVLDDMIWSIV